MRCSLFLEKAIAASTVVYAVSGLNILISVSRIILLGSTFI